MLKSKSALLIAPALTLGVLAVTGGTAFAADSAGTLSSASTTVRTAPSSTGTITIKNYSYTGPGTVAPGASISVTNQDSVTHTVTADSGSAFSVLVQAGTTATFTAPSTAGTYAFHCNFHGNMHGSLTVATVSTTAPAPAPSAPSAPQSASPQMSQMPMGAPATGATSTTGSSGVNLGLIGDGAVLVLAGGGAYALRRRMTTRTQG